MNRYDRRKDDKWFNHYILEPQPILFRAIGELESVPIVKPRFIETTLNTKNEKLQKMTKKDARKLGGKNIRVLYMYDPKQPTIIGAGYGKMSYSIRQDRVSIGSGSGPRTNIIDWYVM